MKPFALVIASALAAADAQAQSTTSVIRGSVLDQAGNPLRGVRVVARSATQIGGAKVAYSDAEGAFRIVGLLPGVFEVTATAAGLTPVSKTGVELSVNAPADLSFIMEVASTAETVTLVQKAPTVNVSAANVKETFTKEFIEKVPLVTPSFQHVADQAVGWFASGTTKGGGNFSVRGGNFYDNNYMIDGFLIQDPTNRNTAGTVNFDAIAGLEVQAAAYGAENAQAQGGVLNVITRSGQNELHSELSAVYRDQHTDMLKDNLDTSTPSRNLYLNANVSGPIVKDRLWFFLSSETNSIVTNLGPDLSGVFTQPHPSQDFLAERLFGKLTWQATSRNKLQLMGFYTPERTENAVQTFATQPSAERYDEFSARFAGLSWDSLLRDDLFLHAQVGYNELVKSSLPENCLADADCLERPQQREVVNGVRVGSIDRAEESVAHNYQLNADLQWFKDHAAGDHRVKLGVRLNYNDNPYRARVPGDRIEQTNGGLPDRLTTYCVNDVAREGGPCQPGWLSSRVTGQNHLAFLQDAWKPTARLTLTPGVALNYGRQNDETGAAVIQVLRPTPHFSAVWDATGDGRTAVRGSIAEYVDTGFLDLARYATRGLYATECRFDPVTMTYSAGCQSSGGLSRNTIGQPCGPTGLDAYGDPCRVPGRLEPHTWEATFGAEREVLPGMALGGDIIYRRYVDQWEDAETNRLWNRGGTALRSDGAYKNGVAEQRYDLSARPEANRRYAGVTIFGRKYDGRFQALIAWTQHYQYGSPLTYRSDYLTNPAQTDYLYGYLSTDQRNEAKLMGSYRFTDWFTVGTNLVYRNGTVWSRRYYNAVTGAFTDLRAQVGTNPRNPNDADDDFLLREPDVMLVYVQLRVNWRPLIRQDLDTWVDLFNVNGERELQGFVEQDGPTWGNPLRRRAQPPYVKLGLRYRF